jgi:hypothetical protein
MTGMCRYISEAVQIRMAHESFLTVRICNNPNRARGLSFVNNVSADDS